MGWTETSTIQRSLLEWAEEAGWEHLQGDQLPRDEHDVAVEEWFREALLALNPELVDDPESADLVIHELNQAVLDAHNGLVAANEQLMQRDLPVGQPFEHVSIVHQHSLPSRTAVKKDQGSANSKLAIAFPKPGRKRRRHNTRPWTPIRGECRSPRFYFGPRSCGSGHQCSRQRSSESREK